MDWEYTPLGTQELHQSHEVAWRRLGCSFSPAFTEIVARYAEPHRKYHTLEHIQACHRWLVEVRELAERPSEVVLALVYHDVVYDPRRSDNEERSADLFRSHAGSVGLRAESTTRICALIEGTATHGVFQGDGALVNDIDLAVLGSAPGAYRMYEQQVRHEYNHLDEACFSAGREHFLLSFLWRERIFAASFFQRTLEKSARANLQWSLDSIIGGRPVWRRS